MHLGLREILQRLVKVHLVGLAQGRKGLPLDILGIDDVLIITDAALPDGFGRIRDQGIQIHFLGDAEAVAHIAGPQRRVEREQPRFQFRHREPADPAGVVAGEEFFLIPGHDNGHAVGQAQGCFQRIVQPAPGFLPQDNPVHDHIDIMLAVLVEFDLVLKHLYLAVHPDADIPVPPQLLKGVLVGAFLVADDRGHDGQAGAFRPGHDGSDHFRDCLPGDRDIVVRTVRHTRTGIQKPQVIIDFRDGADRGTGVVGRSLLVNGDRRGQAFNQFDIRLVHPAQELPGVGTQRLHISSLALSVNCVKSQGGLAAAGQAGHDNQFIARDVQGNVLQVIFPGTPDNQFILFHYDSFLPASAARSASICQASRGERSSGETALSLPRILSATGSSFFISIS